MHRIRHRRPSHLLPGRIASIPSSYCPTWKHADKIGRIEDAVQIGVAVAGSQDLQDHHVSIIRIDQSILGQVKTQDRAAEARICSNSRLTSVTSTAPLPSKSPGNPSKRTLPGVGFAAVQEPGSLPNSVGPNRCNDLPLPSA